MCRICVVVSMLCLVGCIVVPAPLDRPYDEDFLFSIQPGITTRVELINNLGSPSVALKKDTLWVFDNTHHIAFAALLWPQMDAGFVDDVEYFVVEFEDDVVIDYELLEKIDQCTSAGICLHSSPGIYFGDRFYFIISSQMKSDHVSKEFLEVPGMCSVYIYADGGSIPFEIDSKVHSLWPSAYFHELIEPGRVTVVFPSLPPGFHNFFVPQKSVKRHDFECKEGSLTFITFRTKSSFLRNHKFYIDEVDEMVGRKAILEKEKIAIYP